MWGLVSSGVGEILEGLGWRRSGRDHKEDIDEAEDVGLEDSCGIERFSDRAGKPSGTGVELREASKRSCNLTVLSCLLDQSESNEPSAFVVEIVDCADGSAMFLPRF